MKIRYRKKFTRRTKKKFIDSYDSKNLMSEENLAELLAAHDFRNQQQAKFAQESRKFSIENVKKILPDAMVHLKKVFPNSEIPLDLSLFESLKVITENDNPLSYALIEEAKDLVEGAANALGIKLFSGVSTGVIESPTVEASQQRLMLTNASVVLVSGHMLLALHRLSKLLALTIPIKIHDSQTFEFSECIDDYIKDLSLNSQLQSQWIEFFVDYSLQPINPPRGLLVSLPNDERVTLAADLGEAMLCFVVGHEYGHHMATHRLDGIATALGPDREIQHRQELEADAIGALLVMKLGDTKKNYFAVNNVGAIAVLKTLEFFRRGSAIIYSGNEPTESLRNSHPDLVDRLNAVRMPAKDLLKEEQSAGIKRRQLIFEGLLDHIWEFCRPEMENLHKQGFRPSIPPQTGWLPF